MSVLRYYDFTFGRKYSLDQKVAHAREGDTIRLLNSNHLRSTSLINRSLTIDGNHKTIHLTKNGIGFLLDGDGTVVFRNLTVMMAAKSHFVGIKQLFSGTVVLDHVTFIFPRRIDPRDFLSPLVSEGMTYTLEMDTVQTDFFEINARQIIATNSNIGSIWGKNSILMSAHFSFEECDLDRLTLKSSYSDVHATLSANNISTFGELHLNGVDGTFTGLNMESCLSQFKEIPKPKTWKKKFANPLYALNNITYLTLIDCGTSQQPLVLIDTHFQPPQSNEGIQSPLFMERYFDFSNDYLVLKSSTFPRLSVKNSLMDTVMRLESITDKGEWISEGKNSLAQVNSTSSLFQENQHALALPAMDQIQQYIGLDTVKDQLKLFIANAKMNSLRQSQGNGRTQGFSLHMIFGGSAGTGKSSIARLFGKALFENGVIPTDHFVLASEPDLVAGYVGQTAQKTRNKVLEALGGVLFIDEAYSLNPDPNGGGFKQEAIDQLVALADEYRDQLVIILAGYTEPMKTFLQANEGLSSRFKNWVDFPDYSIEELFQILDVHLDQQGAILTSNEEEALGECFYRFWEQQTRDGAEPLAGNGRTVRNFVQDLVLLRDLRLSQLPSEQLSREDLQQITLEDIKSMEAKLIS